MVSGRRLLGNFTFELMHCSECSCNCTCLSTSLFIVSCRSTCATHQDIKLLPAEWKASI